jgi:CheY-like chemotaxis protein
MARILIVEDDESVRLFAARALTINGHAVDTAEDGERGLAMIRKAGGSYDLVVSDIRMPVMDGIALGRAVAAEFPAQRILLMTGYAEQRIEAESIAGIVVGVLDKPFSISEFRQRVEAAFGG